ncbi:Yos1-like protein [Metarhizium rileyi]|uniref:Yos1-like protein n=1 Tax=Metarhizium rileyi (strain RCEF 4871) TaxID=1649241 RepID=A0A167FNY6_METRR|nr:Yos1-like protein [Metarhizium rileyi RCEF 4871]
MLFFGSFLYITVLLINAVAILSEDRFLARINLSPASYDPAFGSGADASIKAKVIHLIASIRTIMRSAFYPAAAPGTIIHAPLLLSHAIPTDRYSKKG